MNTSSNPPPRQMFFEAIKAQDMPFIQKNIEHFKKDLHLVPFLKRVVLSQNLSILGLFFDTMERLPQDFSSILEKSVQTKNSQVFEAVLLFARNDRRALNITFDYLCRLDHSFTEVFLKNKEKFYKDDTEAKEHIDQIIFNGFVTACQYGYKKTVEACLPFVDPKRVGSQALVIATAQGNENIVHILYPLSDPKKALNALEELERNSAKNFNTHWLRDRIVAEQTKKKLTDALFPEKTPTPAPSRPRRSI